MKLEAQTVGDYDAQQLLTAILNLQACYRVIGAISCLVLTTLLHWSLGEGVSSGFLYLLFDPFCSLV